MRMSAKVPDLSFSHVGLYVHELPMMEDFYTRVLGFTVTDRGLQGKTDFIFLSRDPEEHHQLVMASGRPDALPFNVVNQISFRVHDLAALKHFYGVVQRERVSEISPVTHGNAISVYFRDPEGNRLELFLDTPWHCTQPCREPVDLSQPDEVIMATTERLVRGLPGFKPRAEWIAELRAKMGQGAGAGH
jgi:catechol 2,3-dioxygenase